MRSIYRPFQLVASALALITADLAPDVAHASVCFHPQGHIAMSPYGDLNGSGVVNVADALCAVLAALAKSANEPPPMCLAPPLVSIFGDLNCDGNSNVADVTIAVAAALGTGFPGLDTTGNGCPDACNGCAPPEGASCFISAQCVPEATPHPSLACQICNPAASSAQWSSAPDGQLCDSDGKICAAGACAATVPSAPTAVVATPGDGRASISFVASSLNGGEPIIGYEVEVSPGGSVATGNGSPIEVLSLLNGTAYTFRVRASNAVGMSAWSEASEPVTPLMCLGEFNGAPCNDGSACTQVDICQNNQCVGGSPVVCTATSQCHNAGMCDPLTGICSNPVKPPGSPCNDGSACTGGDACNAGVCAGTSLCSPVGSCVGAPGADACQCPVGAVDELGNGTQCTYLRSCAEIRIAGVGNGNGIHWIDPDGNGPNPAYQVHCNQTLSEGGWTLLYTSSDDGTTTFTWNNRTILTTNTALVGNLNQINRDFKSRAHHELPFNRLLFVHAPSGVWAEYAVNSQGASLGAFIQSISFPHCPVAANSGYPMIAGTLTTLSGSPGLCDTHLYFHLGDHDGGGINVNNCTNLSRQFNNAVYGPAWNGSNNGGCNFDDPYVAGTGPSYPCVDCGATEGDIERIGAGFGYQRQLNTAPGGTAGNYIQVFAKTKVGYTAQAPGRSCLDILNQEPTSPTGTYWIDPNGAPHTDSFQVQCDMATKGGGWTRLYFKDAANSCTKISGVTWTSSLIEALQFQDYAVSASTSTLNVSASWILYGVTLSGADGFQRFAHLSNCLTPTGTAWSQSYTGGYLFHSGTLDTVGAWTTMFSGCGNSLPVGGPMSFRAGGATSHTGEFIHTSCNDYTSNNNSITSRWDWNNVRAMWVR